MRKNIGMVTGWLVVALLIGANLAFASSPTGVAADFEENWSCGEIIGPGGETHPVCIDYLYADCSCSFCVLDCGGG